MADRSHYHNCMELGECVAGGGVIEIGRQAWPFTEGTIAAAGRGLHHCQQNVGTETTRWRYVLIDEDVVLREAPPRHRPALRRMFETARTQGFYFDAGEECAELRFLLRSMFEVYGSRREMARMELEAMTCLLACVMARTLTSALGTAPAAGGDRRAVEPALRYVSANYMRELRIEDLAASCAMSVSYFRKIFARIMGMPPLEYVNRYRVNRALNLLRSTNATVLQIAGQTGFPSVATFNRNFRRYVGNSPSQWRKSAHI